LRPLNPAELASEAVHEGSHAARADETTRAMEAARSRREWVDVRLGDEGTAFADQLQYHDQMNTALTGAGASPGELQVNQLLGDNVTGAAEYRAAVAAARARLGEDGSLTPAQIDAMAHQEGARAITALLRDPTRAPTFAPTMGADGHPVAGSETYAGDITNQWNQRHPIRRYIEDVRDWFHRLRGGS